MRSFVLSVAAVLCASSTAHAVSPLRALQPELRARSAVQVATLPDDHHDSDLESNIKCSDQKGYCGASCVEGGKTVTGGCDTEGHVCCVKTCTVADRVVDGDNGHCMSECGEGHAFQSSSAGAFGCNKVPGSEVKCCSDEVISTKDEIYDALKAQVESLKQPSGTATAGAGKDSKFGGRCDLSQQPSQFDKPADSDSAWTTAKWFDDGTKNIVGVRRWSTSGENPADKFHDILVVAWEEPKGTKHVEKGYFTAYAGKSANEISAGMLRMQSGQWHMVFGKHKTGTTQAYDAFRQYRPLCVDRVKDWKGKINAGTTASAMDVEATKCGCYTAHLHSATTGESGNVKSWSEGCNVVAAGLGSPYGSGITTTIKAGSFYKKVLDAGEAQGGANDDIIRYSLINAEDLSQPNREYLFGAANDAQ